MGGWLSRIWCEEVFETVGGIRIEQRARRFPWGRTRLQLPNKNSAEWYTSPIRGIYAPTLSLSLILFIVPWHSVYIHVVHQPPSLQRYTGIVNYQYFAYTKPAKVQRFAPDAREQLLKLKHTNALTSFQNATCITISLCQSYIHVCACVSLALYVKDTRYFYVSLNSSFSDAEIKKIGKGRYYIPTLFVRSSCYEFTNEVGLLRKKCFYSQWILINQIEKNWKFYFISFVQFISVDD